MSLYSSDVLWYSLTPPRATSFPDRPTNHPQPIEGSSIFVVLLKASWKKGVSAPPPYFWHWNQWKITIKENWTRAEGKPKPKEDTLPPFLWAGHKEASLVGHPESWWAWQTEPAPRMAVMSLSCEWHWLPQENSALLFFLFSKHAWVCVGAHYATHTHITHTYTHACMHTQFPLLGHSQVCVGDQMNNSAFPTSLL